MNRYRMQFAPRVWKPKLSPALVRLLGPWRVRNQQRTQRLMEVEVVGGAKARAVIDGNVGTIILPNHSSHADPYAIYAAADQLGSPLYIMATWHVFQDQSRLVRWLLQKHGCFSVDREANDIGAFKRAVEILQSKPQPLVVFPEGEIYHCNDRVTPFREGAAAIAIAAARRSERRTACVPCAITYRYLDDPTESLTETMGQLEEAIHWRRQNQLTLQDRIYRFAEALLVLKELEYFQQAQSGELADRIAKFSDFLLVQVEERHGIRPSSKSIPERVKEVRRTILEKLSADQLPTKEHAKRLYDDLEDVFLVVQSFSYPGDYVSQVPTLGRLAETIDKFEEDVLRLPTATVRGRRKVRVEFGDPIEVPKDRQHQLSTKDLTQQVEDCVQVMLDNAP